MVLTVWFGAAAVLSLAAAMLSLAAANLRLLLSEAAALDTAGVAPAPRR